MDWSSPQTSKPTFQGSRVADVLDQSGLNAGCQSHTQSLQTLFLRLEGINDLVESAKQEMHNLTTQQKLPQGNNEIQRTKHSEVHHILTEAMPVNNQLETQNKRLQINLANTKDELDKVKLELRECKTRLGRHMSNTLTENNPQIADLSDSNRPTKLAEKHMELYDNEWTDAFEELEKKYHSDETAIKTLLEILKEVNKFCQEKSVEQNRQLKQVACMWKTDLERESETSELRQQIKDFRKYTAELGIQAVCQDFALKTSTENADLFSNPKVRKYTDECVKLCWLMSAQDPQVVFALATASKLDFNIELYKPYTSSGPHVKYVVWPALLLHRKGPLLVKGVAQGYTVGNNKVSIHGGKQSQRSDDSLTLPYDPSRKSAEVRHAYGAGQQTNESLPSNSSYKENDQEQRHHTDSAYR